jgi:hypothetical protein
MGESLQSAPTRVARALIRLLDFTLGSHTVRQRPSRMEAWLAALSW